jgi:hypothetical protein
MVIFHSYVSLPEGNLDTIYHDISQDSFSTFTLPSISLGVLWKLANIIYNILPSNIKLKILKIVSQF